MLNNQIEIINNREVELLEKNRKVNLQKLFTPEGMDLIIAEIEKEVVDFSADITTKEGRLAIKSMAAKIAKCKTPIKNLSMELKEESRKLIEGVNAQWNRYEAAMDSLRDKIRKPVDDIEEREAKLLAERRERIERIRNHSILYNSTLYDIEVAISNIKQILDFDNWGEFQFAAEEASKEAIMQLETLYTQKQEQIKKDAELEQLRKEAAERAQKDREEQIAREAAEKAKREAEAEIERQKQEEIKKRLQLEDDAKRAEAAKLAAEQRAKEAERLAVEQAKQAEERRVAAEKKAKEDAEKAAQEAVEREREKVAMQKRLDEIASEKAAANKKHRARVEREAAEAIVKILNETEEDEDNFEVIEKKIVSAIVRGEIPHVQINY